MLAIERRAQILDQLKKEKRVLINQLSVKFGVSEETIRRDMEKLEQEGFVTRTYGGRFTMRTQGASFRTRFASARMSTLS